MLVHEHAFNKIRIVVILIVHDGEYLGLNSNVWSKNLASWIFTETFRDSTDKLSEVLVAALA